MKITINDKSANIDKRGCRNLKHMVDKVQKEFLAQNEVIVRLVANGTDYSASDENHWESIPSPKVRDLHVHTSSIKELSLQSIEDVQQYLVKVQGVLQQVIVDIGKKSSSQQAIANFHDVIRLFDGWILPIIDRLTTLYKISLDTLMVKGTPAIEPINAFIQSIDTAVTHLERCAFEDFRLDIDTVTIKQVQHIQEIFVHLHSYIKTHSK